MEMSYRTMMPVYINLEENEETQDFNRCWWVREEVLVC
jgi:hypothetical protein